MRGQLFDCLRPQAALQRVHLGLRVASCPVPVLRYVLAAMPHVDHDYEGLIAADEVGPSAQFEQPGEHAEDDDRQGGPRRIEIDSHTEDRIRPRGIRGHATTLSGYVGRTS